MRKKETLGHGVSKGGDMVRRKLYQGGGGKLNNNGLPGLIYCHILLLWFADNY